MTKTLHGLELFQCPTFHSYIRPSQCEQNRKIARGETKRLHRYRGRYKFELSQETLGGFVKEARESRRPCLKCPGVLALQDESA